jgi:hypothetical protein
MRPLTPIDAQTQITAPCEALVDQSRQIGSDPVGYWCGAPATHEYSKVPGTGVLLCDRCVALLGAQPHRLTLSFQSQAQREAAYNAVLKGLKQ